MDNPRKLQVASNPIVDNKLPHLRLELGKSYPSTFFLPGDPDRVMLFAEHADTFQVVAQNREFTTALGTWHGIPFGVTSTGIGSGSTEIAVVELSRCGVKTLIRVGGCGALREDIGCGSFIINSGAVRHSGSSSNYVSPEFPAVADPFVCTALAGSATLLKQKYVIGIGASIDSYYEGQYRQSVATRQRNFTESMDTMIRNNVLNFDMETETIFTLSYLFGMKAGSVLGVHGNRITDTWLVEYLPTQHMCIEIALHTLKNL